MIKDLLKKTTDIIWPPLIQFSPIRSGSTLVYNILSEIFPNKRISKTHNIDSSQIKTQNVIITYRNPLDSLTSSFKRYNLDVNDSTIKKQLDELKKYGLDDLISIFENQSILKLKYEKFHDNYDYIFYQIEDYFDMKIPSETRNRIIKKYAVEEVIKLTSKFEKFSEFDKKNKLHGRHISDSKGQPNSYLTFFNEEQIEMISNELKDHITILGY